jgi:hypothetical protein
MFWGRLARSNQWRRIPMCDGSVRRNKKHFWIKIAPPLGTVGVIVHGTLICEDSEAQIFREAVDFVSANSNFFEIDWLLDILRPSGLPPVCRAEPITKFIMRREREIATDRQIDSARTR